LRSHALIHRHLYRGQIWYVLQDQSSGRFHRFSPIANMVIGLMNGQRTTSEIWEQACERLGDEAPTQDEVIGILSSLHQADVLRTDTRPDMQELHARADEAQAIHPEPAVSSVSTL
jgi:putative peptide zinc metalloprotease protein